MTLFADPPTTRFMTSASRGVSEAYLARKSRSFCRSESLACLREGFLDSVEEIRVPKRFSQKIPGTGLHRADGYRHVAMAGDENDRNLDLACGQLLLELQPAHAGHADICHEAGDTIRPKCLQKRVGRFEGLVFIAGRLEQQAQRLAHAAIVVDDIDHTFIARFVHSASAGSDTTKVDPPPARRSYLRSPP
jgi:hypothetical protein